MNSMIFQLREEALKKFQSDQAISAFNEWKKFNVHIIEDEAKDLFIIESIFILMIKIAILNHLNKESFPLSTIFPNIFNLSYFNWFIVSSQTYLDLKNFLNTNNQDGGELFSWLYQFSIPEKSRKKLGQFYTSNSIVQNMLDEIQFTGNITLKSRLIDPACGAGAFLIEATKRIISQGEKESLTPEKIYRTVQNNVYGLDINPFGVLLCEASIALLLVPYLKKVSDKTTLKPLHLYVTDSLIQHTQNEDSVVEQIKSRTGNFIEGFDFVVANPPYAKIAFSDLTVQQKERFDQVIYGHPNLYALFLQIGTELLAEHGQMIFINPKSFVSGLYFKKLRTFMHKNLNIQSFSSFRSRTEVFQNVLQEVIILHASKNKQSANITLNEYDTEPVKSQKKSIQIASHNVFLDKDMGEIFFIDANQINHMFLQAMVSNGTPLNQIGYKAITGKIVWNRLKDHITNELEEDTAPFIWSNGIKPYQFQQLGNRKGEASYLKISQQTNKLLLAEDAILIKRLTSKEEAKRIIACRIPDVLKETGYFTENHVNLIIPTTKNPLISIDALIGLLNSQLFDQVFRALNGNTQVSATELNILPIVTNNNLQEIEKFSQQAQQEGINKELQKELDKQIFKLYGL